MLEAWLLEGEEVCIEKRGKPIALLTGVGRKRAGKVKNPDFESRRKAIWGDRVFSEAEVAEVAEMRSMELEGEEG